MRRCRSTNSSRWSRPLTIDEVSREVADFWAQFSGVVGAAATDFTAWAFGADDDPDQQTRLGRLVLEGPKRATTSRLDDYADEPMPSVGDHSVILDGAGVPLCIIETTHIEVRRFDEVDESFARSEGEGDWTLRWWRTAHLEYFARVGTPVDDATEMVLEWFDVVWPRQ